jgi:hypothetical protein
MKIKADHDSPFALIPRIYTSLFSMMLLLYQVGFSQYQANVWMVYIGYHGVRPSQLRPNCNNSDINQLEVKISRFSAIFSKSYIL